MTELWNKFVFKQYSNYARIILKQVDWNYGSTILRYLFLNLEPGESDENDCSDFEILLHPEGA